MANVSSPEKNFFDLPPEIRNNIYHQLFDGQKVVIRGAEAAMSVLRGQSTDHLFSRERLMGLNLIFVSKQCLEEARPVLLSTAVFNVEMSYMYSGRRGRSSLQTWPRNVQGFSEADLTLIRKLELPYPGYSYASNRKLTDCVFERLLTMPSLHSVIIRSLYSWYGGNVEDYIKDVSKKSLLQDVVQHGYFKQLGKVADHVQSVAQRTNHTAQFLLQWYHTLPTAKTNTILYADVYTDTIWVVKRGEKDKVVVPKRVEPALQLLRTRKWRSGWQGRWI